MARIIYSGLVTKISGSVGGTTFQANAYGFTVKNKANMVKPNSPTQNKAKLILSVITKGWNQMDDSGRNNWNTFAGVVPQYAKHNPSSVLSGFAAYVRWHVALYQNQALTGPIVSTPNLTPPILDTATFTLVNAAGVLTLNPAFNHGDENWGVNISLSRPFSVSQNFIGTTPRNIIGDVNANTPFDITAKYLAAFGTLPQVGDRVPLQYVLYDALGGIVVAPVKMILVVT
jgi:hypothetical protein